MFGAIRDFFLVIGGIFAMVKRFFVRWFLPLHSDEADEQEELRQQAAEEKGLGDDHRGDSWDARSFPDAPAHVESGEEDKP